LIGISSLFREEKAWWGTFVPRRPSKHQMESFDSKEPAFDDGRDEP
jgi:hypothetical protein